MKKINRNNYIHIFIYFKKYMSASLIKKKDIHCTCISTRTSCANVQYKNSTVYFLNRNKKLLNVAWWEIIAFCSEEIMVPPCKFFVKRRTRASVSHRVPSLERPAQHEITYCLIKINLKGSDESIFHVSVYCIRQSSDTMSTRVSSRDSKNVSSVAYIFFLLIR